ncbi:replication protein [Psychrobacillus antarcticus]|uniref:replication protein n=1 Tax=Psychrobacillus antarcticus TaxID=2879115 RepID=UPI0024080836|nr:replication protein [Psychrobacillus antarcticus]
MANPQLNNGHTRIANEIFEQMMKTNLNGTQFRLVMAIWRYTYGFQRKANEMSTSFLAKVIDANRTQINRELSALIDRNIITVIGIGSKGARVMGFNKNHKEWDEQAPTKEVVPEIPVPTNKIKKLKYDEENTYYKMAVYFFGRVEKVANDAGISHLIKKSNMQTWADDMRKLIEVDELDKHLVKEVMDWVTEDSFWRTNVLSAKKLREKFMELAIKMNAEKKPGPPKQKPYHDPRDKEIALQKWISEGNDPDEFDWSK